MKRPVGRLLMTLVALVCLTFGSATPASAGTLTGATFTAPAGWTTTGASAARYDWGFTTATSGTLSKVTATVPPGTGGKNRYLVSPRVIGNSATTPDSTMNSIVGDLDIRADITASDWTPSSFQRIAMKSSSYAFTLVSSGAIEILTVSGGTSMYRGSTVPVPFADGSRGWVRVTLDADDGAGNRVTRFYTSTNGTTWNQLGSTQTRSGVAALDDTANPFSVGDPVGNSNLVGKVHYAELRNGIDGPVVNKFDPNEAAAQSPSSWTSSTGEPWTVNRNGTNMPADIATDLSVGPVEGLPSGGTANYRFIDGIATYNLPTATSVNAGTNVKLNLGGFTNTTIPGSYTSTIRAYDNTGPPATEVDNATTSALSFSAAAETSSASVVVDPSLTFTASGLPSACNGVSPTSGASSTATSINFGRLPSTGAVAAQTLTVASNGTQGAVVSGRVSGDLSDGNGHTIPRLIQSNWSSATAFPAMGTPAFGYSMSWFTNPDTWIGLRTVNDGLMQTFSPGQGVQCIAFKAQPGTNTPAGSYSTRLIYTAFGRY